MFAFSLMNNSIYNSGGLSTYEKNGNVELQSFVRNHLENQNHIDYKNSDDHDAMKSPTKNSLNPDNKIQNSSEVNENLTGSEIKSKGEDNLSEIDSQEQTLQLKSPDSEIDFTDTDESIPMPQFKPPDLPSLEEFIEEILEEEIEFADSDCNDLDPKTDSNDETLDQKSDSALNDDKETNERNQNPESLKSPVIGEQILKIKSSENLAENLRGNEKDFIKPDKRRLLCTNL